MASDELLAFWEHNSQARQLSSWALSYRSDLHKFARVLDALSSEPHDVVDFPVLLASNGLVHRSRIISCITRKVCVVADAYFEDLMKIQHAIANPHATSKKLAKHCIYAQVLSSRVAATVSDFAIQAALTPDPEERERLRGRVTQELDVLHKHFCVPLVAAERESIDSDAQAVHRLITVLKQLLSIHADSGRGPSVLVEFLKVQLPSLTHIIAVVADDQCYTASRIPTQELLRLATHGAVDDATTKCIYEWTTTHAQLFKDLLESDLVRLRTLEHCSDLSPCWNGAEVTDKAEDPCDSAVLLPPTFVGKFINTSGRIVIKNTVNTALTRGIGVVRALVSLRTLIVNNWLPFGLVSVKFAQSVFEMERDATMAKSADVMEALRMLINESGFRLDDAQIDAFLSSLKSQPQSSNVAPLPQVVSRQASVLPCDDFLVIPMARQRKLSFMPWHVPRRSFFDYVTLCSLAKLVNETIEADLRGGTPTLAVFDNQTIVSVVEQQVHSLRDLWPAEVNRNFLSQAVASVIKRVMATGAEACNFARSASAQGAIKWRCSFAQARSNGEYTLDVGKGAKDSMTFIFLELVARIKAFLDESFPLPTKVTWKLQAKLPAKRAHRRTRAKSPPEPSDESAESAELSSATTEATGERTGEA